MCNVKSFEKDLRAYFPYGSLTEYDFKRVVEIFNRHKEPDQYVEPKIVTQVIYKESPPLLIKNICKKCSAIHLAQNGAPKKNNKTLIPIERIEIVVCAFFGFTPEQITTKKRTRKIALARHYIFYFARKYTMLALGDIGKRYLTKDHTSVSSGDKKIKGLLENNPQIIYSISLIEEYLLSENNNTKDIEAIDFPESNRKSNNKKQAA